MHPASAFQWEDRAALLAFIAERAFATITATLEGRVSFVQVPVLVDGDRLVLHLSRGNVLARALPLRVGMIVTGPDAYVSPDWYDVPDQVPTWSYVSVELEGQLVATDDVSLLDILRRQSATFEGRIAGKTPWTPDKMTPSVLAGKLRGIVGATLTIEHLRGTRKLSQNKSEPARAGVAAALATSRREADRTIADLMRL